MDTPLKTVFYTIERTIKEYRKFAQKNISRVDPGITIDQALVLILINDEPDLTQKEISDLLFKDNASMTRMIELMVKRNYLLRIPHETDRRRYNLQVTDQGRSTIQKLNPVIGRNRKIALNEVSSEELRIMLQAMNKIIVNCNDQVPVDQL